MQKTVHEINQLLEEVEQDCGHQHEIPKKLDRIRKQVQALNDELNYRKSEISKYDSVFRNLHDAVTILNEKLEVVYANPAFEKMTGFNYQQKAIHIYTIIHPDDRNAIKQYYKRLENNESVVNFEGRVVTKNGDELFVQMSSAPDFDNNGKLTGTKEIIRDVTQETLLNEELSIQVSLDAILSHIAELYLKDDYNELDSHINEALKLLGSFFDVDRAYIFSMDFKKEIMSNTHEWCNNGVPPEVDNLKDLPLVDFPWWKNTMREKRIINIQNVNKLKDSDPALYDLLAPQKIKSLLCVPMIFRGETKGFLGFDDIRSYRNWSTKSITLLSKSAQVFISIIEHYHVNQEKEILLKRLSIANKDLKDFAHIVSHDLKAPLRGISAIANWICEDYQDQLDDTGNEYLAIMQQRVLHMENLVKDILDYSSLAYTQSNEKVCLHELLDELKENLDLQPHQSIVVKNDLPVLRHYNRTRLYQLFQNLISNGFTYNRSAEPRVEISSQQDENTTMICVKDNGIGIDQKYTEKIFQLFQQLDKDANPASTGIGLAIVKKVVEIYGGNITLESKQGVGSTFKITLPLNGE